MNRFWVGNGGLWANTDHWAETSGGPGGFSYPTIADNVYFDENSFTLTGQEVSNSYNISPSGLIIDWSDVTNNPNWDIKYFADGGIGVTQRVNSSTLVLSPNMTMEFNDSCPISMSGVGTLTGAGQSLGIIEFRGVVTGTYTTLLDDLSAERLWVGMGTETYTATLDADVYNVALTKSLNINKASHFPGPYSQGILNMGSGTWTFNFNVSNQSGALILNGTINAETSTIVLDVTNNNGTVNVPSITSTNTLTTLNNFIISGANGGVKISFNPSITFNSFTVLDAPKNLYFYDAKTFTFTNFTANGTDGNLITIRSILDVGNANFSVTNFEGSYIDVSYNTGSGADIPFNPLNSIDSGNTTNWFPIQLINISWIT